MEAEILLNLSHPGIPIIYDLESDEDYFYLIEEYVSGVSIREHLLNHTISHRKIVDIAVKLCEILDYLHSASIPVFYNDLKLEHIFLCQDQVRLIDFGIAGFAKGDSVLSDFGTKSYLPPEAVSGNYSKKSDVYALAECLLRMYEASLEKDDRRILSLIKRGKCKDLTKRPSISEYSLMWQQYRNEENLSRGRQKRNIYVVGSDRAVGTTHIAISTACLLNYYGGKYAYYNIADPNLVHRMAENDPSFYKRDMIYHEHFVGLLSEDEDGPKASEYGRVVDCGCKMDVCDTTIISDTDVIILVIGTCAWQGEVLPDESVLKEAVCICNPANTAFCARLAKRLGKRVYGFMPDKDAFSITEDKKALFKEIYKRGFNE